MRVPRILTCCVAATVAAVSLAAVGPRVGSADTAPLRVMAMGDSITQGFDDGRLNVPGVGVVGSWRYWFWQERAQKLAGCGPVDMVGEWSTFNNWAPAGQLPGGTDQDHQATSGSQIDGNVRSRVFYNRAIERAAPDVILLLLGTNDLFNYNTPLDPPSKVRDDMVGLIDLIRSKKPDVAFMLMGVNPRGGSKDALIQATNVYYQEIAATRDTPGSPIEYVDGFGGLDPAVDTIDWVHPSISGQHKISDRFAGAVNGFCASRGGTTTTTTVPSTTTTTVPSTTTTTTLPTTSTLPATLEQRVADLETKVAALTVRVAQLEAAG